MRFATALWDYGGEGSWHFVSVPPELSDELRARSGVRRGFGSIRVRATTGTTTWSTSVFPSKDGGYVLPVKRSVRSAEGLDVGDVVEIALEVVSE